MHAKILGLCVVPAIGASAFFVPQKTARTNVALQLERDMIGRGLKLEKYPEVTSGMYRDGRDVARYDGDGRSSYREGLRDDVTSGRRSSLPNNIDITRGRSRVVGYDEIRRRSGDGGLEGGQGRRTIDYRQNSRNRDSYNDVRNWNEAQRRRTNEWNNGMRNDVSNGINMNNGINTMNREVGRSASAYDDARREDMMYDNNARRERQVIENDGGVTVQGETLKTWSIISPFVESVKVNLSTEGRPLNADVDLWQGPDNTPQKMSVYLENGNTHPFRAIIQTPRGTNSVAVRNTSPLEYPMSAEIGTENRDDAELMRIVEQEMPRVIQGGAMKTFPFEAAVASVLILLKTDGRPLNAKIELLQGPNNEKQVVELYSEDGLDRPFFAVIETPGSGNVVRIVNTATMEYPMTASVLPYELIEPGYGYDDRYTTSNEGLFMVN